MAAAVAALAAIQPGVAAAVTGFPGSGKTRDTQFASAHWRRSIVFDPYSLRDRRNTRMGQGDAHPWPGSLVSFADLASAPDMLESPDLRLVVYPVRMYIGQGRARRLADSLDPECLGRQFESLGRMAWSQGGGTVIVAEEAGLYSRNCAVIGQRIATGGRHGQLAMVALSQGIGRLHIDFRRCMALLCTGHQGEPADVDSIRDRCGEAFARRVQTLKHGAPLLVWRAGERT